MVYYRFDKKRLGQDFGLNRDKNVFQAISSAIKLYV